MTSRVVPIGDATLVVELDERIDIEVNARAVALAERIGGSRVAGVRDIVPTFRSVAVSYDPMITDVEALSDLLTLESARDVVPERPSPSVIDVPVCYDTELGPDLELVAAYAGMDPAAVARIHSSRDYRVFMLGFMPGFAYMGVVDPRIAAPRLATPRVRVEAGSVGIAATQTGIYPSETPGGWNIIGRTPMRTWHADSDPPTRFNAGDTVRFRAIDRAAFDRLFESSDASS
jgi:KipI family sensor histidine kinase inhibitor